MGHQAGRGTVVTGVQSLRQRPYVDALIVKLLNGPESLRQVPRQAVNPRDHHRVPGVQQPAEFRPRLPAHVLARGHVCEDPIVPEPVVVEDSALGGQPALSLRLGDPDIAENRGIDGNTSGR